MPLIGATDLELPLDGATFRLTRTRSGNRSKSWNLDSAVHGGVQFLGRGDDLWWDWTGEGWMIGENPLLVVDAALPDVTGDAPRTTWLILDAHHSIPFQQIETTGTYEAPPRFRARMTCNGVWSGNHWSTPPTQYVVSLFEGAVTYRFVVIREDVPPNWHDASLPGSGNQPNPELSSYHDRPVIPPPDAQFNGSHDPYHHYANSGFGIPYYGICTEISDQYGHAVEIDYCGSVRRSLDDANSENCFECAQDCLAKGQIKSIRLKSGGEVKWTLVYAHRAFADTLETFDSPIKSWLYSLYPDADLRPSGSDNRWIYELNGHRAIDRIYVFSGSVDTSGLDNACLLLSHLDGQYDTPDPLTLFNALPGNPSPLPTSWRYCVRYFYHHLDDGVSITEAPLGSLLSAGRAPVLVKTEVLARDSGGSDPEARTSRTSVYHYDELRTLRGPEDAREETRWLSAVFTDSDLAELFNPNRQSTPDQPALPPGFDIDDLALWQEDAATPLEEDLASSQFGGSELENWLLRFASVRLERSANGTDRWATTGDAYFPAADRMLDGSIPGGAYITIDNGMDPSHFATDSGAQLVTRAVIRGADGTRSYRIMKLLASPPGFGFDGAGSNMFHTGGFPFECKSPHRSIFASPFLWRGYAHTCQSGPPTPHALWNSQAPGAWDVPRWITVIDEFVDEARMVAPVVYTGTSAVKPGQLSRRVVQMNAPGFVLRDKVWNFRDGEVSTDGGGLGSENLYLPTHVYFSANWPADPDGSYISDQFARELILVERRSVGWSAANLANQGTTAGLVRFFEYELYPPPVQSGASPDWSKAVQPMAEGIRRGTGYLPGGTPNGDGGPRLYTRQLFRKESPNQTELTCEVNFVVPRSAKLPVLAPPAIETGAGPLPDFAATYHLVERAALPSDTPPDERRVIWRGSIGPPRHLAPGSHRYFPVDRQFFDEEGHTIWSASGMIRTPEDPSACAGDPMSSLVFTRTIADSFGRPQYTIIDAGPGTQAESPEPSTSDPIVVSMGTVPDTQWVRIATTPPLNYITATWYDNYGASDVFFPSCRRFARRFETIWPTPERPQKRVREWVFNDLVPVDDVVTYLADVVGELREYASSTPVGPPEKTTRVKFTQLINPDLILEWPTYETLAQIAYSPDRFGRVQKATLLERMPGCTPGPNDNCLEAVGSKFVNDLGEVFRTQELDRTITRRTRNSLGHFLRTYIGTDDSSSSSNNMILTERLEYGAGINDAWLPTISRRYTSNPPWAANEHAPVDPEDDDTGIATVTGYDWRMRPVRIDSYGRGKVSASGQPHASTPRLSTSLTFLDHADRPVLAVQYGPGDLPAAVSAPNGALNPTALIDLDLPPTPRDFLAATPRPLSLVETIYTPDGTMVERRTYDVAASLPSNTNDIPDHQAERTYKSRGGQELFAQRPGQPIVLNQLDGAGRVVRTASVRPAADALTNPYELSATETIYDPEGNVIETIRAERASPSGNALVSTNSIRSRTLNWYDVHKRLRASVDLGTEDPRGYVAGPLAGAPFVRENPPWVPINGQVPPSAPPNIPPSARLSVYEYDEQGNQVRTMDPDGTITRSFFSPAGRLLERVENAEGAESLRRSTKYRYELGRLVEIAANRVNPASGQSDTTVQKTSVSYAGATVVDDAFSPSVSEAFAQVASMHLPSVTTGAPSTTPSLSFKYNFAGQIAERTDARGVTFRYHYDDESRLKKIEVGYYDQGTFHVGYPAAINPLDNTPFDRVAIVEFLETYIADPTVPSCRKRIYETIARSAVPTPTNEYIIAHTRSEHDPRGNMTREYQQIGAAVSLPVGSNDTNASPYIDYSWHYAPTPSGIGASGHNRLVSMQYPKVPQVTNTRQVNLNYDTGLDADLSRLSNFSTTLGTTVSNVATFTYAGTSRRATMSLAAGKITQSWRTADADANSVPAGLNGLDLFGRPRDLHYRNTATSPATLYRAEYSYDQSGNRTGAKITQAPASGNPGANKRSQVNQYDELDRLVGVRTGELTYSSEVPVVATPLRTDEWTMDLLGNWIGTAEQPTGPPTTPGRLTRIDADADGTFEPTEPINALTTPVDARNRIQQIWDGDEASTPPWGESHAYYDAAGNLIFDGRYFYQYDAWSRLVQVNKATQTTTPNPGYAPSFPIPAGLDIADKPEKQFTYDGLGRLIRTQSPLPDSETTTGLNRTERFYYDGIRRIQEVVIDDVPSIVVAGESGNPGLENLANELTEGGTGEEDGDASPGAFEQQLIGGPGGGGPNPLPLLTSLKREYIWGPGDNGLDELLVQYDPYRQAQWALMDSGGDLVALCDTLGTSGTQSGLGRVVAQWTFDAYGNVTSAENIALPMNAEAHLGHKGMFLERLDVGVLDSLGGLESPRLEPGSYLVTHNRHRNAHLSLGRWLQSDPNGTGTLLQDVFISAHGQIGRAQVGVLAMESMYSDGGSTYAYLQSSPWLKNDAFGLYAEDGYSGEDLFEDVTDVMGMLDPLPGPGDIIRSVLQSMVQNYAANLEWDTDWATDWNQADNWSTREDSTWVTLAIGEGLHSAFDIGLPFTDESVNPLDFVAGAKTIIPTGGRAAYRNVMNKPLQVHHIATNKGSFRAAFKKIFDHAGESLDTYTHNQVTIPHSGRHNKLYHEFVLTRLQKVQLAKQGAEAARVLEAELKRLGEFIKKNPHMLYESSGGRPTNWGGMRDFHYGKSIKTKRMKR